MKAVFKSKWSKSQYIEAACWATRNPYLVAVGESVLEVILLSVLEASADPSSLEFLKLSVLIYLDGKHPSASDIVVNLMTSLVSERHGSKIKKTSEFFKLGLFDLLSIISQDFLGDNRFCLRLFLAIPSKILFKLIEATDII